ncbi:cytochrome B6 [Alicyclobacillaceae bacterium I2511]|nr:cytochrome B6 [Alicyclobacillaceae bacterium I2511]
MKKARFSRDTLRFPQKEFDMVKEGTVALGIVTVVVLGLAAAFGSPYRPAITNQQIAQSNPLLFAKTALGDLDGTGEMAQYGPPYNNGFHGQGAQSTQSLGGFAPEAWWGTPYHLNTAKDDVLQPLTMLAKASNDAGLSSAVQQYQSASFAQQMTWDQNMEKALKTATTQGGQLVLPTGNYGPVSTMISTEVSLGQSGLFSGALDRETNQGVYRTNVQNDLLFLQGTALHQIAGQLNMKGEQWGINHDEQAYPGPWWLTPYTFLYQVPPWSVLANGDQMAAYTMGLLFLVLILVPFIPGLNKLPRLLSVHRLIWRDWYKHLEQSGSCTTCPFKEGCAKEFRNLPDGSTDFAKLLQKGELPACYRPLSHTVPSPTPAAIVPHSL